MTKVVASKNKAKEVYRQGSICWCDLNPTKGHEQHGRRPVLIVSNDDFFRFTHMYKIVAISSSLNQADFPLNVKLNSTKTNGFVLTDQERTIDPNARPLEYIEDVSSEILNNVLQLISETY